MRRILIVNLGGVGDILLSTPALRGLRNLYSKGEISMLSTPKVYEIVKDLSYFDKLFTFDIGYGGVIPFTKIFNNIRVLLSLRKIHFDLAVNMRTLVSKRSAKRIRLLLDIINPETKAGRDTEGRGYFFDIKVSETEKGRKYEMEYDIDIVKALGGEAIDRVIDFKIGEDARCRLRQILEKESMRQDDILIGIHPGGMPSRRWPLGNFSRAIEEIHKKISCRFVISGSKEEMGLAEGLTRRRDIKITNLAGRLSVKELGALIERCNLYISNDTGPMHIAAVLKTSLVAIFGPGDIVRFDPRNISKDAVVLYKKTECAPCEKAKCRDLRCLKTISSAEVIDAALKLLAKG